MLSSYSRMLMVSKAHVVSASRPDFRDIITRQASGVPGNNWNFEVKKGLALFFIAFMLFKTQSDYLLIYCKR